MTQPQMEHWLLPQLRRLSRIKPASFEQIVAHVKEFHPDVYEELCLMAVEHGELAQSDCAVCLATDVSHLAVRLEIYRSDTGNDENAILIEIDENGTACLVDSGIFVWEIVREHRKRGSLESLKDSYSSLTEAELRAALRYADRHPDEIQRKIRAYEERFVRNDA